MLREVLRAVESAGGPITLNELSRQLSIDPGVLDGMLAHWSRRGKLMIDAETGTVLFSKDADKLIPPASLAKLALYTPRARALKNYMSRQ